MPTWGVLLIVLLPTAMMLYVFVMLMDRLHELDMNLRLLKSALDVYIEIYRKDA